MGLAIGLGSLHHFKIMAARQVDRKKMWLIFLGVLNLPSIMPSQLE